MKYTDAARARVRRSFFALMRRAANTDDGRAIVRESLDGLLTVRPTLPKAALAQEVPYRELGRAGTYVAAGADQPVFITARFRSGSTLLWNLFRRIDGFTSYYEPLNERRWFDPAMRGNRIDGTHKHVDDYWKEYDGLEEASRFYRDEWISRCLYMDESSWDPDLADYIRLLIRRANGRPALQFNRVDFRLPWLRHTFPEARIVHLYRHPRDQWCSSLVKPEAFPSSCGMAEFTNHDHFYLTNWAADLKDRFPFLDPARIEHPYRLFYFIWKLSFLYGIAHADCSLSFEALVARPALELERLFQAIGVEGADVRRLAELVEPSPSRWARYADNEWFRGHEAACEDVLRDFFPSAATLPSSANASRRAEAK